MPEDSVYGGAVGVSAGAHGSKDSVFLCPNRSKILSFPNAAFTTPVFDGVVVVIAIVVVVVIATELPASISGFESPKAESLIGISLLWSASLPRHCGPE